MEWIDTRNCRLSVLHNTGIGIHLIRFMVPGMCGFKNIWHARGSVRWAKRTLYVDVMQAYNAKGSGCTKRKEVEGAGDGRLLKRYTRGTYGWLKRRWARGAVSRRRRRGRGWRSFNGYEMYPETQLFIRFVRHALVACFPKLIYQIGLHGNMDYAVKPRPK
jgi:hypothetical protein